MSVQIDTEIPLVFICRFPQKAVSLYPIMQIAFTTTLPKKGFARLAAEHSLFVPLEKAEVLVSTFDKPVTREMIASAPNLRLIANFGAGYNNIDLDACRERGIRVTNTPHSVVEPTAELAFALMLDVARRTVEFDKNMRRRSGVEFGVMNNLSHSLYGKVLGIVGMGRIGQALARRAVASGMTIVYHNRHRLPEETERKYGATYVSLDELLRTADFVSLNLPYTPEVHHIIGSAELQMMKPSAYLVNTARGAHVDEDALAEALRTRQIAGAALDVFEHEPQLPPTFRWLNNIVLSPHTGTGTWEGRLAMCEEVCDNILAFAAGNTDQMSIVI